MILDVYCHLNKSATSFQVVFLLYAKCDIFLKCLHVLILFKLTAIVNKIRVKYTIICSNKWIHLYNYVQSFIKTMKGGGGYVRESIFMLSELIITVSWIPLPGNFFFYLSHNNKKTHHSPPPKKNCQRLWKGFARPLLFIIQWNTGKLIQPSSSTDQIL